MRIQFLGTSAGAPTKQRNVTGLALGLDQGRDWYLFDCGEATQHQLMHSSFSVARLSKIFITHLHGDHIFGLPGLLTSRSMVASSMRPITIYGPKGIRECVETSLRLSASHLTYDLNFEEFVKEGVLYATEKETVSTIRLSHDVPSFAYKLTEADRPGHFDADGAKALGVPGGPLLGELSQGRDVTLDDGRVIAAAGLMGDIRKGRTLIVGGDNDEPGLLVEALRGADLFIHEATLTEAVKEKVRYPARHSTGLAVGKAAHAAGIPNLILTHISARFGPETLEKGLTVKDIENEARTHFDGTLFIANDLDMFTLSLDGELEKVS